MSTANFAHTLYALGHWLMSEARVEDAAHVYRTMLTTVPTDERGWLGLASTHERRGEDEVADRLYVLAERAVPLSFRMPLARARLRRRVGVEAGTDEAYEQAIELAHAAGEDDAAGSIEQEWRSS